MPLNAETINQQIQELENQNNIKLTQEAKQILSIPLEEFYNSPLTTQRRYDVSDIIWKTSLNQIFTELRQNPSYFDEGISQKSTSSRREFQTITSISVIKAFHSKFCNIPPFCKAT